MRRIRAALLTTVSARRGNDHYNTMSHIGFRLVTSESEWRGLKFMSSE